MVLITEMECIYCAVRFEYLNIFHVKLCRHLRSVHVRFVVDKFVPGQIFLQLFGFSHVIILPLMRHTHLHLHVALAGQRDEAWDLKKNYAILEIAQYGTPSLKG